MERIAMERGVSDVVNAMDIDERTKDLITADLLYVIYFSPSQTGTITKKHGAFSMSIGGQYITNRANLYREMLRLYAKWGDTKMDNADGGGMQWME